MTAYLDQMSGSLPPASIAAVSLANAASTSM